MNMLIDFRNLKLFFPSSNECPELNCSFRFFQCRYTVIEAPDEEFGRLAAAEWVLEWNGGAVRKTGSITNQAQNDTFIIIFYKMYYF